MAEIVECDRCGKEVTEDDGEWSSSWAGPTAINPPDWYFTCGECLKQIEQWREDDEIARKEAMVENPPLEGYRYSH